MLTALLYIYLVVTLIFVAIIEYVIHRARNSNEYRVTKSLREFDGLCENMNLDHHGMAILCGLLWPLALYILIKGK